MRARLVITLLFMLGYQTSAQRLWNLHLSSQDYFNVGSDSSVAGLKAILREHDPLRQTSAMQFLALRAGESARSFLLDSLRIDAIPRGQQFDWGYYFCYQLVRGYYGDQRAIAGMDTVVRFGPRGLRITAESWLIAAQHFLHFDLLKQAISDQFERPDAISNLAQYGTQANYRTETTNILAGIIRDSAYSEIFWRATKGLAGIDKSLLVVLLNERFLNSNGALRYNFFRELNTYDREGQPERTMWVLPREQDIARRNNYFPRYVEIVQDSISSTRYLLPPFLKFATDWAKSETSKLVLVSIRNFVADFKPFQPPESTPISKMLDDLTSYSTQVLEYGWLADANFAKELDNGLDNGLDNAKKHLGRKDSVNAYKEVQTFQKKVNKEYDKTVDNQKKGKPRDKRFVTIEGWKLLYYNAQYIMDRLPSGKKK